MIDGSTEPQILAEKINILRLNLIKLPVVILIRKADFE
jgi:hypothetical protein